MTQIRVLRGMPTAEELAAVVAVLLARPAAPAPLTGYDAWRAKRLAAVRVAEGRKQRAH